MRGYETPKFSIRPKEWSFIVATADRTMDVQTIFINGIKQRIHKWRPTHWPFKKKYINEIGSKPGEDRTFIGEISALLVYNYILPESQIKNMYKEGRSNCFSPKPSLDFNIH
jgi:hypothetical protein